MTRGINKYASDSYRFFIDDVLFHRKMIMHVLDVPPRSNPRSNAETIFMVIEGECIGSTLTKVNSS